MLITADFDYHAAEKDMLRMNAMPLIEVSEYASTTLTNISVFQQRDTFTEIHIGQTCYAFKCMLSGRVDFDATSGLVYNVEPFSRFFEGTGTTLTSAVESWRKQFHILFQELDSMRLFEFDRNQQALWGVFEQYLDIEKYRNSQPLIVKQIGKIVNTKGLSHREIPAKPNFTRPRNIPSVIQWLDGSTEEVPPIEHLPNKFILLEIGQYFEAHIHKNRKDGAIIRIESFTPIKNWDKRKHSIDSFVNFIFDKQESIGNAT